MKISKKLLAISLSSLLAFSAGLSLFFGTKENNSIVAESTEGYTTYYRQDLGFNSRDPNDTRVVIGDVDGGMQTKGNDLATKSEIKITYKNTQSNYWIGVGGIAIYVSNASTLRVLNLGYSSNGQYSRNALISGLTMKTYDGTTDLKTVITGGGYFTDYVNATFRFDLTNRAAAKVQFFVEYGDVTYYLYNGDQRIDTYTCNQAPSSFNEADYYRAMAGVNATDAGVSVLKFKYYDKNFADVISGNNAAFNYSYIGDFTVSLNLSKPVTSFSGYLNDHLNGWLDEYGEAFNIGDYIIINGRTLSYWVNYNNSNIIMDSSNNHGVHQFPVDKDSDFDPVVINVNTSRIKFFFNDAFFASDSVTIVFKSGFKAFYVDTNFILDEDLTFYSTLNTSNYSDVGANIVFVKGTPTEVAGNYAITNPVYRGELTAEGGFNYHAYTLWTNIPRDSTNMTQGFPHDHYRYLFENVLLNGRTFAFYNAWGRANEKDFIADTLNPMYETEHPAGNKSKNFNVVTYLSIATDQPNYVMFVDIPNQLMEDFGITACKFSIRTGSAWATPEGTKRANALPENSYEVNYFIENKMHMEDYDVGGAIGSTKGNGSCVNYFDSAKEAYNELTSAEKLAFVNGEDFAPAKDRFNEWARINNYTFNPETGALSNSRVNPVLFSSSLNQTIVLVAVIILLTSIMTFAVIYRKRKTK